MADDEKKLPKCANCKDTKQIYAGDHYIGNGKTEPYYAVCNHCIGDIPPDFLVNGTATLLQELEKRLKEKLGEV